MPIVDEPCMHVENLFVTPELRRRGIAKLLLGGAASVAERSGAEQVVISSPPSSRDAQRFLARLGFTPFVIRRMASTAALRRRLAGEPRRGALEDLLSRRRSLRARAGSTPAEGIAAQRRPSEPVELPVTAAE
jgi:GNAT superfamily N-acetyltransferase